MAFASIAPDQAASQRGGGADAWSFSIYEARGDLQFYVDQIETDGVGLRHAQMEALKAQLEAEGCFDMGRKRPLPLFPRRIGVVTSASGAALHDILTVLSRRYPLVEVLLSPCLVQGQQAAASIAAAIQAVQSLDLDVLIVARGGGDIEDLWAFNEEVVARAVFACPVPVVSGVGHETDTTMIDYVADVRAATPSAAAELVVPDRDELNASLQALTEQLHDRMEQILAERRQHVRTTSDRIQRYRPTTLLAHHRQQVDDLLQRAGRQLHHRLTLHRAELQGMQTHLMALNPNAVMQRGYAIVRHQQHGPVLTAAQQASTGDVLEIALHSGRLHAQVIDVIDNGETPTEKEHT